MKHLRFTHIIHLFSKKSEYSDQGYQRWERKSVRDIKDGINQPLRLHATIFAKIGFMQQITGKGIKVTDEFNLYEYIYKSKVQRIRTIYQLSINGILLDLEN